MSTKIIISDIWMISKTSLHIPKASFHTSLINSSELLI